MSEIGNWTTRVNRILVDEYAITIDVDAGASPEDLASYCETWPEPREFVDWFARKYDLTGFADWELSPLSRHLARAFPGGRQPSLPKNGRK